MHHRRYYIHARARTTADGVVRASSDGSVADGAALAREGDPVDCPACQAQGIIRCAGLRLSDRFEGKEYALSGDLCICRCDPPPTLVGDRQDEYQLLGAASDDALHAGSVPAADAG